MNKLTLTSIVGTLIVFGLIFAWPDLHEFYHNWLEDEVVEISINEGVEAGVEKMYEEMDTHKIAYHWCHEVISRIGKEAVIHEGFDKAMSYSSEILGACTYGFVHGAVEQYLTMVDDPVEVSKTMCERFNGNEDPQLYPTCIHGAGHGYMAATDNNLPLSMEMCTEAYSWHDGFERICIDGNFMENFDQDGDSSDYIKEDDLTYPCEEQEGVHKSQCYEYIAEHFLHQNEYWEYGSLLAFCDEEVNPEFRRQCFDGAGKLIMQQEIYFPKYAESFCLQTPDYEAMKYCTHGLLLGYYQFYNDLSIMPELCSVLDPLTQQFCPAKYLNS